MGLYLSPFFYCVYSIILPASLTIFLFVLPYADAVFLLFSFFIKLKLAYGIRLISPVILTVVRGARGSTLMVHRQIKPIVESQEVNYLGNHSINEITK